MVDPLRRCSADECTCIGPRLKRPFCVLHEPDALLVGVVSRGVRKVKSKGKRRRRTVGRISFRRR